MKSVIDINNLCVLNDVNDLYECVNTVSNLLSENGYTDEKYSEAIANNFDKYGKNFIVSPYVILPHARPEQGVLKNGVSIALLKKPCFFKGSNIAVRIIIVLAARSTKDHLEFLKFFANILTDENRLKCMLKANSKEELYEVLMK